MIWTAQGKPEATLTQKRMAWVKRKEVAITTTAAAAAAAATTTLFFLLLSQKSCCSAMCRSRKLGLGGWGKSHCHQDSIPILFSQ
jgi:hypothetical protein